MCKHIYLHKITYYVTGHLYDFTGTCCVYLSRFKINKTIAIRNYLSDFRKEASCLCLLTIRSIIAYSHSSSVGSNHICYVKARLFLGEEKRESASDEMAPTVHSLDRSKDKKCPDPKLNKIMHDLSERSETYSSKVGIKLSEDNKKKLSKKISSEIFFDGVSSKSDSGELLNKHFVFNMLVCLNEKEREKEVWDNILKYWNASEKRFVNIHDLTFSFEMLMFAYSDILKVKNNKVRLGNPLFFNEINQDKIYDLSNNLKNGV